MAANQASNRHKQLLMHSPREQLHDVNIVLSMFTLHRSVSVLQYISSPVRFCQSAFG